MTKETLFMAFDAVDAELVADAGEAAEKKKSPVWLRWGAAAACLCLLAAGGLALKWQPKPAPAGGGGGAAAPGGAAVPGGSWPEGVDPKIASMAIYPDTEKVQDVLDAEILSLSEDEALAVEGLGDRLPASLPEGYAFSRASLYVTTMKSGQTYHMLRVQYRKGSTGEAPEDAATPVNMFSDGFTISVYDCTPRTEKQIYVYTPLTDTPVYRVKVYPLVEGNGTFFLRCEDVYFSVSPDDLKQGEVELVLDEITEGYCYNWPQK